MLPNGLTDCFPLWLLQSRSKLRNHRGFGNAKWGWGNGTKDFIGSKMVGTIRNKVRDFVRLNLDGENIHHWILVKEGFQIKKKV